VHLDQSKGRARVGQFDQKTLSDVHFQTGDFLDILVEANVNNGGYGGGDFRRDRGGRGGGGGGGGGRGMNNGGSSKRRRY
jgi:hypothetical protein